MCALFIEHPPEWHEKRRQHVGASDARVLMSGTADEIEQLRLEKLGRYKRPPILSPWDTALRRVSEILQLDWYEHVNGVSITSRGRSVISPDAPHMSAELDGFDDRLHMAIDAKHLSEWTKQPLEWAREHYAWQVVHQAVCCGTEIGVLSIMHGMKEPVILKFEIDPFEASLLIERVEWFWEHVTADRMIEGTTPIEPPKPLDVATLRKVDMEGNNEWAVLAGLWLENRLSSKRFDDATKDIKSLLAKDIGEATGHGIKVTRDGRGLKIKEIET